MMSFFDSFSELNDVRVAFQVYEAGDMRGMKIDTHTQLRALKVCFILTFWSLV